MDSWIHPVYVIVSVLRTFHPQKHLTLSLSPAPHTQVWTQEFMNMNSWIYPVYVIVSVLCTLHPQKHHTHTLSPAPHTQMWTHENTMNSWIHPVYVIVSVYICMSQKRALRGCLVEWRQCVNCNAHCNTHCNSQRQCVNWQIIPKINVCHPQKQCVLQFVHFCHPQKRVCGVFRDAPASQHVVCVCCSVCCI